MRDKYTILLTAIGGDVSQSAAKVLRGLDIVDRIIGVDLSSDNPHFVFVDAFYVVPRPDSAEYISMLENIVEKEKVDFVIPISEPEVRALWEAKELRGWNKAQIVIPGGLALPLCLDNLDTVQFLEKRGIVMPWTRLVSDDEVPKSFPCVMKDRWSWGSRSFLAIEDEEAAEYFSKCRPNSLFQEKLLPSDQEYTCGIFRNKKKETASIIFKRTLSGPRTGKATVVIDEAIENLCNQIASILELRGSINVQLIKTEKGPIPFDINPRFSGTVAFRDLVGFKDVLWSLLDQLNIDFQLHFSPSAGTKIYRTYGEAIIHPKEKEA